MPSVKWSEKQDVDLATTRRFEVRIDPEGFQLGGWNRVSGLGFSIDAKARNELGVNTYQYQMLDTPKWTPITLTRAVFSNSASQDWHRTYTFIMSALTSPVADHTLSITMMNAWGTPVRTMSFTGARLTAWKVNDMDAAKGDVATEVLTFIHEGLFPTGEGSAFT